MNVAVTIGVSLKRVLFAADFSSSSLAAFPYAASIARHYGGEVILARVNDISGNPRVHPEAEGVLRKMLAGAEGILASEYVADTSEPGSKAGSICPMLLSVAEQSNVDLIVIGTHGLTGIRRLLRGSKAEEVRCLSSKPVLIVGPRVSSGPEVKRILYATDYSPNAMRVLSYADSLREVYGASLVLLHVDDGKSGVRPTDAKPRLLKFIEEAREQGYAELSGKCDAVVQFGPRAERMLEAAEAKQVDLIVLGVQAKKGIRARVRAHLPGSLPYEVISQAHCPVLTVPLAPPA